MKAAARRGDALARAGNPFPRAGEFFAPLPLAALALLVVNDAWLKPMFHSALTGKLSDVALCFLLPLFISELLGLSLALPPRPRLAIGAVLTSLLFGALEVVPSCTRLALRVLTALGPQLGIVRRFQMTSDPTDLFCLLLVPLAVVYGARRLTGRYFSPLPDTASLANVSTQKIPHRAHAHEVRMDRRRDRSNPIGLHRVTILAIDGVRLRVRNLEALNGTPVIDVKPALDAGTER